MNNNIARCFQSDGGDFRSELCRGGSGRDEWGCRGGGIDQDRGGGGVTQGIVMIQDGGRGDGGSGETRAVFVVVVDHHGHG